MNKNEDKGLRDLRDIAITIMAVLLIISMIHYDKDGKGLYLGLPIVIDNGTCSVAPNANKNEIDIQQEK